MKILNNLSYGGLIAWIEENGYSVQDLPLTAQTIEGADAIIEWWEMLGEKAVCVSVLQNNNWWRKEVFHRDGTHEELYFR